MCKEQLRFTGSGGQGVILATIIIAEAAFLDGKKVVQSQSYGPEARGGMCKAEAIVDENVIHYTKIEVPSLLLSLTQVSFDKYIKKTDKHTIIVVDEAIEVPDRYKARNEVVSLPILSSAKDVIKNPMAGNIISVGAVNEILHISSVKSLEEAVLNHIPKGTEELNLNAMHLGAELAKKAKAKKK